MGFVLSLFFGFVPMGLFAWFLYWLDRYEKEPRVLLGAVFAWGAIVAAGVAFVVNTLMGIGVYLLTESDAAVELTTGTLVAPPVEESLKGLAVLLVFALAHKEFDSILDGMVYAGVAALGFAATENAYYIYQYGFLEEGLSGLFRMAFLRVVLIGWQHPFYTAFIGIGLATARLSRNRLVKWSAPVLGWLTAVVAHSLHNALASLSSAAVLFFFDWSGWLLMFLVALWAVRRVRRRIQAYLRGEVEAGTLTAEQYRIACSARARSRVYLRSLFRGRYAAAHQFYQLCAELAHKKFQFERFGDEGGNRQIIEQLRSRLAELSPLVG